MPCISIVNTDRREILLAGLALAIALVMAAIIGSWTVLRVKAAGQTIEVTGSAKKRIKSDLIIWRTKVTASATQLVEAYAALNRDVPKVRAYLVEKGVQPNQIVVSAITTTPIGQKKQPRYEDGEMQTDLSGRITGYSLQQTLEVRSNEVDKIAAISRAVTDLINQGILLESQPPEYLYTKLGDLKIEMLAEAARDAKVRAERIATATGSSIGPVRDARMGVMQITPADSTAVSDYGVNDTTSVEKDVTAVVRISFAID
jgi:hypothetical protein